MSLKRVWAYPVHVMIQTTSVCNSACIMCPWPVTSKTLPQGRMDQSLYKKIIDEVSRHPEVEKVMPYLMNEPLTDPRIVDFINLAKQKNPQAEVYIVSNGIALNEDLTERLLASGLDWIGFSVHAIREKTYEQITGRSDFEKIRDGVTRFIRRAREVGKHDKYVMINLTRVRPYVSDEEVKEAFAYWKSQGIDPVDYVDGYISRAGNVNVWNTDKPFHTRIQGCKTLWAYKMVHILFNGDVVPCCMDWGREAIWGNVREQSIEQIWHGEKRRVFQEMIHSGEELPPEFICCRCEDAVPATEPIKEAERPAEHEVEQAEVTASAPPEKLEAVVSDSEKRVGDLESRLKGLLERQKAFLSERKQ